VPSASGITIASAECGTSRPIPDVWSLYLRLLGDRKAVDELGHHVATIVSSINPITIGPSSNIAIFYRDPAPIREINPHPSLIMVRMVLEAFQGRSLYSCIDHLVLASSFEERADLFRRVHF
jgi:hypothetical protein